MKNTILLFTLGILATANAATVTYDFNTGLGDSTAGSALTAGSISYAVGTNSDGEPTGTQRAWDPTAASGDYMFAIGQRGVGNSGIADAALDIGAASQVSFTLTPNADEWLDFSGSSLNFDSLIYHDASGANMKFAYKVWADTGSGFTALAPLQSISTVYVTSTGNKLREIDETTPVASDFSPLIDGEVMTVKTPLTFDLSSLGTLATNQAVSIAITLSCNRNNQFGFLNGIDNLTFDVAVPVSAPEPPVANDDAYDVEANSSFTNAAPGVLENDTDANGDTLTANLVSFPTNGTLVEFLADGSFVYQPDPAFEGMDSFTYEAIDVGGLTGNVATVSLAVSNPPPAVLILPSMLGSNRVIQRNQPIPVWGWGEAGETVTVSLSSGQSTSTVISAEGKWEVALPAMAATTNALTMTVSTVSSTVTITNLLVGDVWLASGQSNAGWRLQFTDGGPEEAAGANHPLYRHFYTSKHPTNAPIDNIVKETSGDAGIMGISAEWTVCAPDTAKYYSAIAYYFARDLQQDLGIPIGIIQAAYAGTAVEAWSKSVLPYPIPDSELFIAAHQLYNGMIHPHLKTPIKGAIWIQGENNRWDGFEYAEKLTVAMTEWRELWNVGDFPFYYIQIPPKFDYENDPMYPLFLEGQTEVENTLANSRMVVISDTTDGSGYHPRNKAPAGIRLAVCALKSTYGQTGLIDSGPRFGSAVVESNTFRISFSDLGSGLAINPNIGYNANGDFQIDVYEDLNGNGILDAGEDVDEDGHLDTGEDLNNNGVLDAGEDLDQDGILDYSEHDINMPFLTWFELCGPDGIFVSASAIIDGDTVVVSSPTVPNPVGVRYAWSKSAIGNLMNLEGLPANSFRSAPPFAMAESYGLHMDGKLYIAPAGILANDETGSSHRPLQRPILGNTVANGTLMLRADGAFIYEPKTGFTGTDSFSYAVTDGVDTSPETTVDIQVLSPGVGTEQINRDVWTGIPGYLISDLTGSPNYPNAPDESGFIDALDAPQNWGDDYGQRIFGYLYPPTNGNYTFFISSSARSEFWLSTDEDPANLVKITSSLDRTPGDWTAAASPVALVGGQRYFIEVLHKENRGPDHVQVAWDLAQPGNGITNIITGTYLSGIPTAVPATTNYAGWSTWYGVSGNAYLLDFAFNLDPTIGDYPVMVPTTGTAGLPYWELQEVDGLAVEYLRRKDAPGTTYAVQFTDNLQSNWVDSATTENVSPINSTWERVTITDSVPIANATNRFGRVTVTQE